MGIDGGDALSPRVKINNQTPPWGVEGGTHLACLSAKSLFRLKGSAENWKGRQPWFRPFRSGRKLSRLQAVSRGSLRPDRMWIGQNKEAFKRRIFLSLAETFSATKIAEFRTVFRAENFVRYSNISRTKEKWRDIFWRKMLEDVS